MAGEGGRDDKGPPTESVIIQEQLVGIINNLLDEQDNFRARFLTISRP